jgi:hypothetical protein
MAGSLLWVRRLSHFVTMTATFGHNNYKLCILVHKLIASQFFLG